jgi:hypothetical protein
LVAIVTVGAVVSSTVVGGAAPTGGGGASASPPPQPASIAQTSEAANSVLSLEEYVMAKVLAGVVRIGRERERARFLKALSAE